MAISPTKQRRLRFRLRSLFLAVTLIAIAFFVLARWPVYQAIWGLKYGDQDRRHEAAVLLASMGTKATPAISALIDSLEYEDDYVEWYHTAFFESYAGPVPPGSAPSAVSALASIGTPAVPALIDAMLHHEDEDVRRWCATALGNIEPAQESAIPHLEQALEDRRWAVREQAAFALFDLNYERQTSKDFVELIADLLVDDDHEYVRYAAITILQDIGPFPLEARHAVAEALHDENREIRHTAAKLLKDVAPDDAFKVLSRIAQDEYENSEIREDAVVALGDPRWGANAATELVKILADRNPILRLEVIDALGNLGSLATVATPQLTAALDDDDPDVRSAAANTLDQICSDPTPDLLTE